MHRIQNTVAIEQNNINHDRRTVSVLLIAANVPNLNRLLMRPEAITAALDFYMEHSQVVGRMHKEQTNSYPVRVWQDAEGNGWLETKVVDDADWSAILSGGYAGMSWGGYAELQDTGKYGIMECERRAEMWENSFVDVPAETRAVFNSEDELELEESLIEKLASGSLKTRIRREQEAKAKSLLQRLMDGVAQIQQSLNPGSGEITSTEEIDMTLEELQQAIGAAIEPLASRLTEIENSHANQGEGAESSEELAAEAGATEEVENAAPALTIADVQTAVENATKPLLDEIEALKAKPGVSQRIVDVGDDSKPAELARCTLPSNDPRRTPK